MAYLKLTNGDAFKIRETKEELRNLILSDEIGFIEVKTVKYKMDWIQGEHRCVDTDEHDLKDVNINHIVSFKE